MRINDRYFTGLLVDIDSCPFERRHFHHVGDADVGELKQLHCRVGLFVL
ncbi:hypothetical protein BSU04_23805 [Caballeronia sordidicola]|uniref:Uncharacterized protein n=1 Tax=Caballeronia sordidicola TaxID=196367 RepID=A0A226WY79_CABSO|nr:hypothetical protein BSU04_23805 [Caballeronia sordidicola]